MARATVIVKGNVALVRKMQRMQNVRRIASPAGKVAVNRAWKIARRNNFGFRNRTGLLRRTLRIEQARTPRGRFATAWQLVAGTSYAAFVEFKRRTRDRRPGPPYWINRAFRIARRRMQRDLARRLEKDIAREARRR